MAPIFVFREMDKGNFEDVHNGIKTVETRAATDKYRAIKIGDEITFSCGGDTFVKKVTKVYLWPSIDAMLEEILLKKIMPDLDTVEQAKARYATYPNYDEKIKEHGLVGFELGN